MLSPSASSLVSEPNKPPTRFLNPLTTLLPTSTAVPIGFLIKSRNKLTIPSNTGCNDNTTSLIGVRSVISTSLIILKVLFTVSITFCVKVNIPAKVLAIPPKIPLITVLMTVYKLEKMLIKFVIIVPIGPLIISSISVAIPNTLPKIGTIFLISSLNNKVNRTIAPIIKNT